ncbi:hypothetical protein MIR68_010929 [Amoeboaphelidium protococcarum]|nr:hypothetical protein MIR68_010929 [Amoeboaphelidium protococcarum]
MVKTIDIPVENGSQVIGVRVDELPDDAGEIIGILEDEQCKEELWIEFAVEYYKQGKQQNFVLFIQDGLKMYQNSHVLNTLYSGYLLNRAIAMCDSVMTSGSGQDTDAQMLDNLKSGSIASVDVLVKDLQSHLGTIERSMKDHPQTIVLKGFMYLLKYSAVNAQTQFKTADELLRQQRSKQVKKSDNSDRHLAIASQLGMAICNYLLHNYEAALHQFQNIFRENPQMVYQKRVNLYLSIGYCWHQLKCYDKALLCFQRSLAVFGEGERNLHSLYMAALVNYNMAKSDESQRQCLPAAISYLKKAQALCTKLDSSGGKIVNSPAVGLLLGHVLFTKGDYEKSITLLTKYIDSSIRNPQMKCQCFALIGKAYHKLQKFEEAQLNYQMAIDADKNVDPEVYQGLAQISFGKGKFGDALRFIKFCTDKQSFSENPHCYKLMASIMSKIPDKAAESQKLFQKFIDVDDANQVEILLRIAEMSSDYKDMENVLRKALSTLQGDDERKLLVINNLACINAFQQDYDNSQKMFDQALECFGSLAVQNPNLGSIFLTILFNMARMIEDSAHMKFSVNQDAVSRDMLLAKADELYAKILQKQPDHVDSILRTAYIKAAKGQISEAQKAISSALSIAVPGSDQGPPPEVDTAINCMLASAWIDQVVSHSSNPSKLSRQLYDKILKQYKQDDVYSMCQLGTDRLMNARLLASQKRPEQQQQLQGQKQPKITTSTDLYKDASKWFDRCLKLDPGCVWAAHGIAIILAENGHLDSAVQAFSAVHDSCLGLNVFGDYQSIPSKYQVSLNYAHLLVEMEQYQSAVALYEQVNQALGMKNVQVLLYLARAYYVQARTLNAPVEMSLCIKAVTAALQCVPKDLAMQFNLALALQQYAQLVCDQESDTRKLEDLEQAEQSIQRAKQMFGEIKVQMRQLQDKDKKIVHNLGFDAKLAEQREKHCDHISSSVSRKLTQHRANIQLQQERMAELKKLREERESMTL